MKEDLWTHRSSSSETCVEAGGQSQEAVPRQGCYPVDHSFPGCLGSGRDNAIIVLDFLSVSGSKAVSLFRNTIQAVSVPFPE